MLKGYCDFNIRSTFKCGNKLINLLPSGKKVNETDKDVKGFTYELIFYFPIRIVLFDDDTQRAEREALRHQNSLLETVLSTHKEWISGDINLSSYNVIVAHRSNDEYDKIDEYCRKNNIPLISFSGDASYEKIGKYHILIGREGLYNQLQDFVEHTVRNYKVDIDFFNKPMNDNLSKLSKEVEKLRRKIKKQNLDYKRLPNDIIKEIAQLIKKGSSQIPMQFNNGDEMERFVLGKSDKYG